MKRLVGFAVVLLAFAAPAWAGPISARGLLGQPNYSTDGFNCNTNDSSHVTGACFNTLSSLALDTVNHRLFTAEVRNNRILVFQLDANNDIISTTASYVLGANDLVTAGGGNATQHSFGFANLAYDPINSRLFVSDPGHNRVLCFDVLPADITNGENATFVLGQPDFTTVTSGTSQNTLSSNDDIEYAVSDQFLYVSDQHNNRVMAFSVPAGSTSSINGENATFELGQVGFTQNVGGTTSTTLQSPTGEAWDPNHRRIFVSDYANNRVMIFAIPSSPTSAINGEAASFVLGQPNFTTNTAHTTPNQTSTWQTDDDNYDAVLDRFCTNGRQDSRVICWDGTSLSNGMNATSVLDQNLWTDNVSSIGSLFMASPEWPHSFDAANNKLYIYEIFLNRVTEWTFIHITTTSLATASVGIPYTQAIAISQQQGTQVYALYSGSLPTGLTLNTSTGVISGTPANTTTQTFTIEADDLFSAGMFLDRHTYTLTPVTPPTPTATSTPTATPTPTPSATPTATGTATPTATPTFGGPTPTATGPTPTSTPTPTPTATPVPPTPTATPTATPGPYCANGSSCSGCSTTNLPIYPHTLSGTTPVGVCASTTTFPSIDIQTYANAASPTLITLPCGCKSGEIMTWHIHQTSSGGTISLPSGTIGPFSAQNGSCSVVGVGTSCTLGVTQSPPSDLDANFHLDGTVWRLEACNPF